MKNKHARPMNATLWGPGKAAPPEATVACRLTCAQGVRWKRVIAPLAASFGLVAFFATAQAEPGAAAQQPRAGTPACPALLQHTLPRLQDEQPVPLCNFAGKVLLVVNTASFCGFTGQYKALEALQTRYGPRGLVVLGFPSNDFGKQEPGDNATIAEFCENTFSVRFPMFAKSVVRPTATGAGKPGLNPLFAELAQRTGQAPGWNFHKYLVGRSGNQVVSYASAVDPLSPQLTSELERLLDGK
jgi:glutathione peroxidase